MSVEIRNLSKVYKNKPLFSGIRGLFGMKKDKYALKNINIKIEKGKCVGIIGRNGSGKSTLLKLICRITSPTQGEIRTSGRISSLLELGTGFNPEYTGISNIYLNGSIQGLSRKEIKSLIPKIAAFADIGDYINRPVKTYSDGMFLRLAFACAIAVKPDILIVDEALAVGDFLFRQKCFSQIEEMKKSGVTVIIVSHDIDSIRRLCNRTIWLDNGEIRGDGETSAVSSMYMKEMTGSVEMNLIQNLSCNNDCENRFGSCVGAIEKISFPELIQTGSLFEFSCDINIPKQANLETLAVSVSFKNSFGLDLTVISTVDSEIKFKSYGKCNIHFNNICYLCAGEYSLCVSLEDRGSTPIKYYDYAEGISTFCVVSEKEYFGTFHTPSKIDLTFGDEENEKK